MEPSGSERTLQSVENGAFAGSVAPIQGELRRLGMEYLTTRPRTVPAGRFLVHNHIRPTRRLGSRGFRAWLTTPTARPGQR
jgi:hypothetical protein